MKWEYVLHNAKCGNASLCVWWWWWCSKQAAGPSVVNVDQCRGGEERRQAAGRREALLRGCWFICGEHETQFADSLLFLLRQMGWFKKKKHLHIWPTDESDTAGSSHVHFLNSVIPSNTHRKLHGEEKKNDSHHFFWWNRCCHTSCFIVMQSRCFPLPSFLTPSCRCSYLPSVFSFKCCYS